MKATNKFRFLLSFKGKKEIKTLQQWWEEEQPFQSYRMDVNGEYLVPEIVGEWRDIPIETQEEYL